MDILVNYLLKKGIIKLSYIQNSFFLYKKLDKRIKLTPSIIALNYASESPYSSDSIIISSIIDNENLYLWFSKGDDIRYLHEAHIIFRRLEDKYKNIICVIDNSPQKVIVIKDSIMVASFAKNIISDKDMRLIKNEYSIDDIIFLTKDEYRGYIEDSFNYLKINDLLNTLNIKVNIQEIFTKAVSFLSLPLLISSVMITMLLAGYSFYLDNEREALYSKFKIMQKSNGKVKRAIVENEKENEAYQELLNEFKYVDKTIALSTILRVTDDLNMTMFYIKIYDKNVDFIVNTSNSNKIPMFVKKLFETNQFKDVKNINSRKVRNSTIEVTMSAKLKEVN